MYFLRFFSSGLPHCDWVKAAPGNVIYKDVFPLLGGHVCSFVPRGRGKLFMQIFLRCKNPNEPGLKNPVARELFYGPVNDCPLKSWRVCLKSLSVNDKRRCSRLEAESWRLAGGLWLHPGGWRLEARERHAFRIGLNEQEMIYEFSWR